MTSPFIRLTLKLEKDNEVIPQLRIYLGSPASPAPGQKISSSPPTDQDVTSPVESSTIGGEDVAMSESETHVDDQEDTESDIPQTVMSSSSKYSTTPSALFALQKEHINNESLERVLPPEQSWGATSSMSFNPDDYGEKARIDTSFLEDVEEPIETIPNPRPSTGLSSDSAANEIIIPLTSDAAFYHLLLSALRSLQEHQKRVQEEFTQMISQLADDIAAVSSPSSHSSSSTHHSHSFKDLLHKAHTTEKSDLYAWRQILQLWVQSEIFESHSERERGERPVEDVERRLAKFADDVIKMGYNSNDKHGSGLMRRKGSRDVLERFLRINVFLLDLKKVCWSPLLV